LPKDAAEAVVVNVEVVAALAVAALARVPVGAVVANGQAVAVVFSPDLVACVSAPPAGKRRRISKESLAFR
jgi:hypothetical protein